MGLKDFNKGRLFQSFLDELECLDKEFAAGIWIEEDFLNVKGVCCHFPKGKERFTPGEIAGLNLSTHTDDELSSIFRQICELVDEERMT